MSLSAMYQCWFLYKISFEWSGPWLSFCYKPSGDLCAGNAGFEATLITGEDLARPVPPERWDVDTPGASDDVIQTNMLRFAAMCPGIDKFDESLFRLGRAEAAAMDPQQRLLLEQIYLAWQVIIPSCLTFQKS